MNNRKPCVRCGHELPLDAFGSKGRGFPHADNHCKACRAQQKRERYHSNPDVRAAARATIRQWKANNPERVNEYKRRYRESHRDEVRAHWNKWYGERMAVVRAAGPGGV